MIRKFGSKSGTSQQRRRCLLLSALFVEQFFDERFQHAILERLRQGDRSIDELVKAIYRDTDPKMHAAAGLSVLAHIEDLVDRKLVETDGPLSIRGIFRPV